MVFDLFSQFFNMLLWPDPRSEDGTLAAIAVQGSYQMGELGVEALVKMLGGEKVDKFINTGVVLVTQDNINAPEAQNVLY